jgi:hypothetical protein
MAVLKSSEGIFLNNYYSLNNNYGCKIHTSTRTWTAYQTGINMFQIYQNGTTSTRQTISIAIKWAAIRTSGSKTELPALHASARASLNTNGTISFDSGFDWHSWGGNGILWPSIGMGGSSLFIGADNGQSTGIIASVWLTICVLEWDKLVVVPYSD